MRTIFITADGLIAQGPSIKDFQPTIKTALLPSLSVDWNSLTELSTLSTELNERTYDFLSRIPEENIIVFKERTK